MKNMVYEPIDIDLLLIMDTTGSMGGNIESAKKDANRVIEEFEKDKDVKTLRAGFVAYRDHKDIYITKPHSFSNDFSSLYDFINELNADGGGDIPEAIAVAMKDARKLFENSPEDTGKIIVWYCDAPPHGRQYNCGENDSYPDGDPSGIDIETEINRLKDNDVLIYSIPFDRMVSNPCNKENLKRWTDSQVYTPKDRRDSLKFTGPILHAAVTECILRREVSRCISNGMSERGIKTHIEKIGLPKRDIYITKKGKSIDIKERKFTRKDIGDITMRMKSGSISSKKWKAKEIGDRIMKGKRTKPKRYGKVGYWLPTYIAPNDRFAIYIPGHLIESFVSSLNDINDLNNPKRDLYMDINIGFGDKTITHEQLEVSNLNEGLYVRSGRTFRGPSYFPMEVQISDDMPGKNLWVSLSCDGISRKYEIRTLRNGSRWELEIERLKDKKFTIISEPCKSTGYKSIGHSKYLDASSRLIIIPEINSTLDAIIQDIVKNYTQQLCRIVPLYRAHSFGNCDYQITQTIASYLLEITLKYLKKKEELKILLDNKIFNQGLKRTIQRNTYNNNNIILLFKVICTCTVLRFESCIPDTIFDFLKCNDKYVEKAGFSFSQQMTLTGSLEKTIYKSNQEDYYSYLQFSNKSQEFERIIEDLTKLGDELRDIACLLEKYNDETDEYEIECPTCGDCLSANGKCSNPICEDYFSHNISEIFQIFAYILSLKKKIKLNNLDPLLHIHINGNLEGTHDILAYLDIISIIDNINKNLESSLDCISCLEDETLKHMMTLPIQIQGSRYYLEKEIVICDRTNAGINPIKQDVYKQSDIFKEPFVEYKILGYHKKKGIQLLIEGKLSPSNTHISNEWLGKCLEMEYEKYEFVISTDYEWMSWYWKEMGQIPLNPLMMYVTLPSCTRWIPDAHSIGINEVHHGQLIKGTLTEIEDEGYRGVYKLIIPFDFVDNVVTGIERQRQAISGRFTLCFKSMLKDKYVQLSIPDEFRGRFSDFYAGEKIYEDDRRFSNIPDYQCFINQHHISWWNEIISSVGRAYRVWKVSINPEEFPRESLWPILKENGLIAIGWSGQEYDQAREPKKFHSIRNGDIVIVYGGNYTIKAIGIAKNTPVRYEQHEGLSSFFDGKLTRIGRVEWKIIRDMKTDEIPIPSVKMKGLSWVNSVNKLSLDQWNEVKRVLNNKYSIDLDSILRFY